MAVGDNFDTSTAGLQNRRSNRIAGSFESGLTKQENNYGHPCNVGCGCKKVCDGVAGTCLLPPELTITIVNTPDGRVAARRIDAGSTGSGDPSLKGTGELYHLIYNNGVWRGRKCCFGDECDPCDVTTLNDGTNAERNCSYYGKEGTHRPWKEKTTRPYPLKTSKARRAINNDLAQIPVAPEAQGGCRPDGEKAKAFDDYCWDVAKGEVASKAIIECLDDKGVKHEEYTDKPKECEQAGFKPAATTRILTQKECLEEAKCISENEDEKEKEEGYNKWTCLSKTLKWSLEWKDGTEVVLDKDGNWKHGGYDRKSCCGGRVIDKYHTSRTPNIRLGGSDPRNGTCVTPYKEVVLKPGRPDNMTPGAAVFECNSGINNSYDRFELHDDIAMSGFTLIIRDCNFYNDYNPKGTAQWLGEGNSLSGEKSGGQETVLFIPMDQIMNCSNFSLTEIGTTINSKRHGWQDEYGDLAGNATGNAYPGDPHDKKRGKDYCMDDGGPNHHTQDDNWAFSGKFKGQGTGGSTSFKRDNVYLNDKYISYDHKDCAKAYYWENGLGLTPHNGRSFYSPGDFSLRKLNLQPQPFKATEWKQNKKKTLNQALSDRQAFSKCIGVNFAIYCHFMGLPFWFEHDFNWGEYTYVGDKYGGRYPIPGACGRIGDNLNVMFKTLYENCDDKKGWFNENGDHVPNSVCTDSKCNYIFQNTKDELIKIEGGICVCTVLDDEGNTVTQGALMVDGQNCPAVYADYGNSEEEATCEFLESEEREDCGVSDINYCTDDTYISFAGCTNGGAIWQSAESAWTPPTIENKGRLDGRPECWNCGTWGGPDGTATWHKNIPPELESPNMANEKNAFQIKHGDGVNHGGNPSSKVDDYDFINMPQEVIKVFSELYTKRDSEREGQYWGGFAHGSSQEFDKDSLDSLDYWGKTGLWPDNETASYIADSFLALNTVGTIQYASNTSPAVIKSLNHGLREGDHISTWGILGNFKANAWTNGEWQERQWQDKLGSPCIGECDNPIWPDVVCPCNNGKCSDESISTQSVCEDTRYEWGQSCKTDKGDGNGPTEDFRWPNSRECVGMSGECYEVNLGGEHFDPKRQITDERDKLPVPNEASCLKYGDSSSEIQTVWVPYNPNLADNPPCSKGTEDDPLILDKEKCEEKPVEGVWDTTHLKAQWEASCTNSDYKNEKDCTSARPTWEFEEGGKFGENNEHCSGVRIKGKDPPPADFFVTKILDNDHFALYTCDGQPLDAQITMGKGANEDGDCVEQGEMACGNVIAPFDTIGVVANATGYTVETVERVVWGSKRDTPVLIKKDPVALDKAETCFEYGHCWIFNDYMDDHAIITRTDCDRLAQSYTDITLVYKKGESSPSDIKYTFLDKPPKQNPDNKNSCLSADSEGNYTVTSECWEPLNWTRKRDIQDAAAGKSGGGGIDSWATCPFTGYWTLRDTSLTNPLISNPTEADWRPYWTETYYKTEKGAEDNYVSIHQEEVCPVCCDHFMPDTIYATVDGLQVSKDGEGGTQYFNALKSGQSKVVRRPVTEKGYCQELQEDGTVKRVGRSQEDCSMKEGDEKSYAWFTPTKYETVYCGINSCTGEWHKHVETDVLDLRTNQKGKVGGEYCCDCDSNIFEGQYYTTGCVKCSDAMRFDDPVIDHEEGDEELGIPADPCCGCDCNPGEGGHALAPAAKTYPTVDEVEALTPPRSTNPNGVTIGKLTCKYVKVESSCESKYKSCLSMLTEEICNQASGFTNGCHWVTETVEGGTELSYCKDKSNHGLDGEEVCTQAHSDKAACNASSICSWDDNVEHITCGTEGDGRIGCAGFPNNRPLSCESSLISPSPQACQYDFGGKKIKNGDGTIDKNGDYINLEGGLNGFQGAGSCSEKDVEGNEITNRNECIAMHGLGGWGVWTPAKGVTYSASDGCGEPNPGAMPTAECWTNKYKTGTGCVGLGTREVRMDYDGAAWVSSWFPMMGSGGDDTEFVGGMNCRNYKISGSCKNYPEGMTHITTYGGGSPSGFGPNDWLCGGCSEANWDGMGSPPVPTPKMDAYLMRLKLSCGFAQYHGMGTLSSYDNYQTQHLNLNAEISKCNYHGCNSRDVMNAYRPPCAPEGQNCIHSNMTAGGGYCTYQGGDEIDGYCTCPVEDKSGSPSFHNPDDNKPTDVLSVADNMVCVTQTYDKLTPGDQIVSDRWWDDDVCTLDGKTVEVDSDGEEITDPYKCAGVGGICKNAAGEVQDLGVNHFESVCDALTEEPYCTDGDGDTIDLGENNTQAVCEAMTSEDNVHTWNAGDVHVWTNAEVGANMGMWRLTPGEAHCGVLSENCNCYWSHSDSEEHCVSKNGIWHEVAETIPHPECVGKFDFWSTVPGLSCDAQPPCTECCTWVPKYAGQYGDTAVHDGRKYTSCASVWGVSLLDSNSTPYGIEGQFVPKWKKGHVANMDKATSSPWTGYAPKTQEVFTVYYVEDSYTGYAPRSQAKNKSDLLVVNKGSKQACEWFSGDPVSIGRADRTEAELGEGGPATRDRLSTQADWPNHPTHVVGGIKSGKDRWKINEQGAPDDPLAYMEIHVENAGDLISRAHMHQEKYWRAAERYLQGEPWPYGDKPWPVGHQTNTTVPSHTVNVGELESVGGGGYTVANAARNGRIGHLPTLENIRDPKKAVFIGEWPTMEMNDDTENPEELPTNKDVNNSIAIKSIENIYDWDNAYCTNPAADSERDCKAIGHCLGPIETDDEGIETRSAADKYTTKGACEEKEERQWVETAWWMPIFKHTEFTTEAPHDLKAGEKIIINGSQCYKAQCEAPGTCSNKKYTDSATCKDKKEKWSVLDETWELPDGVKNLDKTLCEDVYEGLWGAKRSLTNLIEGCPPLCRLDKWFQERACDGDWCPDCITLEKDEGTVCPECVIDGSHVVGLIKGDEVITDPDKTGDEPWGEDTKFTILSERAIIPETQANILAMQFDANMGVDKVDVNPPDWNEVLNDNAVTSLGHEVGGGAPKNIWKGAIYQRSDYFDPDSPSLGGYFGGSWSRHGGTFNIVVGAKPQLDDCAQGNSDTPVNLTYFFDVDNATCNHYMPVIDDKWADKCWRVYCPYSVPNMSFEERGRALFRVDIHE